MKFILILFFVAWLQLPTTNLEPVIQAFKTLDMEQISSYFDENVEISLLGDSTLTSKFKAKTRLTNFLKNNSVTSFRVIHQIQSKNGCSGSFIANLKAKDKAYRLFVLVTVAENKKILIQEINIREK